MFSFGAKPGRAKRICASLLDANPSTGSARREAAESFFVCDVAHVEEAHRALLTQHPNTEEDLMSAKHALGAFVIATLIGSVSPGSAQEVSAPLGVAGDRASLSLTENSWDFTKPDSIPGFGTLPQNYDTQAVLPKFSGK
jgi:hypothetical protein